MNADDSFEKIYRTHTFFYDVENKSCHNHNATEICTIADKLTEHIHNCGKNTTNIVLLYQGTVLGKTQSVSCDNLGRYLYKYANQLSRHVNGKWFIDFGHGFTIRFALSFSVILRNFYLAISNVTLAECTKSKGGLK